MGPRGSDDPSLGLVALNLQLLIPMLQLHSRQLGEVEINPDQILEFPNGVPGFEHERRFILVEKRSLGPIVFLQCIDTPEVCFFTAPVTAIDPNYQLAMTPEDLRVIGWDLDRQPNVSDELICLAVLAAPENGQWAANLLAPIIVNPHGRRGVQAVRCDSRYSHQHPVGASEAAC